MYMTVVDRSFIAGQLHCQVGSCTATYSLTTFEGRSQHIHGKSSAVKYAKVRLLGRTTIELPLTSFNLHVSGGHILRYCT